MAKQKIKKFLPLFILIYFISAIKTYPSFDKKELKLYNLSPDALSLEDLIRKESKAKSKIEKLQSIAQRNSNFSKKLQEALEFYSKKIILISSLKQEIEILISNPKRNKSKR